MAVKLLRESSETPNITNKDDVKMIRYAYGGYNGVIEGVGEELNFRRNGDNFIIDSGRAVIDGWEIDIDVWATYLSASVGTFYFSVYLEVDASLEIAQIKVLKDTASYPVIDKGDDLTESPQGTARMLLYNIKATVGSGITGITSLEVTKKVQVIPYLAQKLLDLEDRVTRLGFKQGNFSWLGGVPQKSEIYKQGNYAIGQLLCTYSSSPLLGTAQVHHTLSDGSTYTGHFIGTLPEEFLPSEFTYEKGLFNSVVFLLQGTQIRISDLKVDKLNGKCYVATLEDFNITSVHITLGYEVKITV